MPHTPLLTRIRGKYLEMPGLRLTLEQAQRLCGVEQMLCKMVLDSLVDAKFLRVTSDGHYARLTNGRHPHLAKASLGAGLPSPNAS